MNDDRISEVYKGEIWSDDAQGRARRRINWLCRQVEGHRVLDIGTSQGIVPILLGREGHEVVGIDIQQDRIAYAREDLTKETAETQARVSYEVGEGSDLRFEDDSFDAIVLGEVIEHLASPERVLEEAARVLRPGGVIAITTPFGVLHHHDHKQTFFPDDVLELVSRSLLVRAAEVGDRYFRIVGTPGTGVADGVAERLRSDAFETVRGIQEEFAATRIERGRLQARLDRAERDVGAWKQRAKEAEARVTQAERGQVVAMEGLRALEAAVAAGRAGRAEARHEDEASDPSGRLAEIKSDLRGAIDARATLRATAEEQQQRIEALEQRVELLQHRERVATWKLRSLRQRRWWRLGGALGTLRRRPWALPSVIREVLDVARTSPPALPRPVAPGETSSGGDDDVPQPDEVVDVPIHPVRPRRDAAATGIVDATAAAMLQYEFVWFEMDPDDPLGSLQQSRPHVVVIDEQAAGRWDPGRVAAARSEARRSGAEVIEVDLGGEQGLLHPRLHNPVIWRPRRSDVVEVEVGRRQVNGEQYDDDEQFLRAVKAHQVVSVAGTPSDADLAPLAATSTMVLAAGSADTGQSGRFATTVEDDEERSLAARALTRSASLAARRAHVSMRRAVREHDIGRLLGTDLTPQVDVMVATNRPHRLGDLMGNVGRQTYPSARLFLVGHGIQLDESEVADVADEHGVELAGVWHEPEDVILGEVFNRGFARTEARLVAKMDDDDVYGAEYLWDLVSARDAAAADVAGKWAHFAHLAGPDTTLLRFGEHEHRFRDLVAISTLLMDRGVLEDEQFPAMPYGSGSVFLRAIGAAGATVFAADRWNYLYRRTADGGQNTFPVSDLKMLSNSQVVCSGVAMDEVIA